MKTKTKDSSVELNESYSLSEAVAGAQIDEANGVIKGVVLMTADKVSANKTKYSRKALQEGLTRYDGAKMYLDHPRKDELEARRGSRSIRDLGGTYRNLHIQESGGGPAKLLGDLHLMEHNRAIALSVAKNPPKDTGLSLRDRGNVREEKGVTLVEGFIGDEFSIDLVVRASLNKGLFESVQTQEGGQDMEIDWSKISLADLKTNRKDLVESIQTEATAPLTKKLEEMGVKTVETEKLAALAESKMSDDFKAALKPALMVSAVSLEEAKKLIAGQEGLFTKVGKTPGKTPDPKVNGQQNRTGKDGELEEGAQGEFTDDKFVAAFGSH